MKLNELAPSPGSRQAPKRVGRGIGSGKGKTAGRGHKGQKARAGSATRAFEGGQMPIYRRLPKRGFHNPFRKVYVPVNLDRLQAAVDAGRLDPAQPVNLQALREAGLVSKRRDGIRLLGRGELSAALTIEVDSASRTAIAAVEKAGGTLVLPAAKTDAAAADRPAKKTRKAAADRPTEETQAAAADQPAEQTQAAAPDQPAEE
jgi:large subunit ribosomal protein L15